MTGPRQHRRLAAAATAVALALVTAACTGSSGGGASDNPNARTTITFWHGWSAPNELKAITDRYKQVSGAEIAALRERPSYV